MKNIKQISNCDLYKIPHRSLSTYLTYMFKDRFNYFLYTKHLVNKEAAHQF